MKALQVPKKLAKRLEGSEGGALAEIIKMFIEHMRVSHPDLFRSEDDATWLELCTHPGAAYTGMGLNDLLRRPGYGSTLLGIKARAVLLLFIPVDSGWVRLISPVLLAHRHLPISIKTKSPSVSVDSLRMFICS